MEMMLKITPEMIAKSGSESAHGKALMCWAQENIEKYPDLKWLTHIGHGGLKDKITAGNMKAEGLKPGVPDYLLLTRRGYYACLWIELKKPAKDSKPAGKVSDEQKKWIAQAGECGHCICVAYGWEQAKEYIIDYLGIKD